MNSIDDFMTMDDQIDALPVIGVKDAYVRAKLMRAMMDHYGGRPDGFSADGFTQAEFALRNYSIDGARVWAANASTSGILHGRFGRIAHTTRAEDFAVEAFDYLTINDKTEAWSEERRVDASREWLKRHVSGSLGMPDDGVIRDVIRNNYAE